MTAAKKIELEAMKLPVNARVKLAEHLLLSLENLEEGDHEPAWLDEADRRYESYRKGKMPYKSVARALRDVQSKAR
jgi:hypothetical protein